MNISENRDSRASLCTSVQPPSQLLWDAFVSFSFKYVCMFLREFYVLQFVPLCCHWAHCSLYFSPIKYLYTLIRSHWPLSSPHWTTTALSASPLVWEMLLSFNVLRSSWLDLRATSFLSWGGKSARKTGNSIHLTPALYEVSVFYYSSTAHTCRLYRLMKLQENQIIFLSAVRMKEMLFSSWRSLYYPMKLWKVSSANQRHSLVISCIYVCH